MRSVGEAEQTGGPWRFLSHDEKCQRGCCLPPLLPHWLAAGILIIFTALSSGRTGEGACWVSSSAGSSPRWRWRRQETQTVSLGAEIETESQTGGGLVGARRGEGGAGLSSQQIKKWAGVLPSVPEETEAQGGQVVPKSSSENWGYKAHGFVGGRAGRGVWSRPWASTCLTCLYSWGCLAGALSLVSIL